MFRRASSDERFRGGVAIGDAIVDLGEAARCGALTGEARALAEACDAPALNAFMQRGSRARSALRLALSLALRRRAPEESALRTCLVPQSDAEMALPARVGDYTDFYASIEHATSIGKLFRPDNPLLPNYVWVPVAYHGRASSLLASGSAFRRPAGQTFAPNASAPVVQPSKRLDYELEVAVWIGAGNRQGTAIPVADAGRHVFGLGLLNDWSARDIQAWEYQPLGPFLGKNSATTVSPWIVTLEALEPFRVPWERREQYPQPLPYLDAPQVRAAGAFDVHLEALIETAAMRAAGRAPVRLWPGTSHRVLDDRSDGRAPYHERMQCGARGSVRHGNDVGCRAGRGRVVARAHLRRVAAHRLTRRRDPHVPSGWRPHRSSRLVRTRRASTHRLR